MDVDASWDPHQVRGGPGLFPLQPCSRHGERVCTLRGSGGRGTWHQDLLILPA